MAPEGETLGQRCHGQILHPSEEGEEQGDHDIFKIAQGMADQVPRTEENPSQFETFRDGTRILSNVWQKAQHDCQGQEQVFG